MPVYSETWYRIRKAIKAALPESEKHLIDDLDAHFRALLENRNERIKELMERCDEPS